MTASVLIIIDQPPYGSWAGREALDMAFALAAFDRPVSLLFRSSGVLWLTPDQNASAISQKTVLKNLGAATVFGVEALLADTVALADFGISTAGLPAGSQPVTISPELYRQYHQVIQL